MTVAGLIGMKFLSLSGKHFSLAKSWNESRVLQLRSLSRNQNLTRKPTEINENPSSSTYLKGDKIAEHQWIVYKAYITELSRVAIKAQNDKKPSLYNFHLFRSDPFAPIMKGTINQEVKTKLAESIGQLYNQKAVKFPERIFDINSKDLIDESDSIIQDFPIPKRIRSHIYVPRKYYYNPESQKKLLGLRINVRGRMSRLRSSCKVVKVGKVHFNNVAKNIEFSRSFSITPTGSTGVKTWISYIN